ncbi:MAG: Txe/YoeB family addiction module toxin [Tannerellaceae bacterium]|nr:Txe/YoeB family addiction module toxin [Tannerellaceae bacterium]
MIYNLEFTEIALQDMALLKKTEIKAYSKLILLLEELKHHPLTGTGKPEHLKYQYKGCYSRRITKRHRLIYIIEKETITVLILSAYGHYEDK